MRCLVPEERELVGDRGVWKRREFLGFLFGVRESGDVVRLGGVMNCLVFGLNDSDSCRSSCDGIKAIE